MNIGKKIGLYLLFFLSSMGIVSVAEAREIYPVGDKSKIKFELSQGVNDNFVFERNDGYSDSENYFGSIRYSDNRANGDNLQIFYSNEGSYDSAQLINSKLLLTKKDYTYNEGNGISLGYAKLDVLDSSEITLGFTRKRIEKNIGDFQTIGLKNVIINDYAPNGLSPSTFCDGNGTEYYPTLKVDVAKVSGNEHSKFSVIANSHDYVNVTEGVYEEYYNGNNYKEIIVPLVGEASYRSNIYFTVDNDSIGENVEYSFKNAEIQFEKYVPINFASKESLMELDGIGDVLAQRIIDYRNSVKSFESIDELINIKGIGKATIQKIKKQGVAGINYYEEKFYK